MTDPALTSSNYNEFKQKQLDQLAKIFYDPTMGYVGANQLIRQARDMGITLQDNEIKQWYGDQKVNQLWKQSKNVVEKSFLPIRAPGPGYIQADLIDMRKYEKANDGMAWILTVIDVYTGEAFARALPDKKAETVGPHLEEILGWFIEIRDNKVRSRVKVKRVTLTTDDGGEFKGKLTKFLKENNVDHYIANPNDNTKTRTALVENFNRIILKKIFKFIYGPLAKGRKPFRYVDILPILVDNYNKYKSEQFARNDPISFYDPFQIGDYVRHILPGTIFTKPTREPAYSSEIYRIVARDGARYKLMSLPDFKILKKSFLPRQLRKVTPPSKSMDYSLPNEKELEETVERVKKKLDRQQRFKRLQRESQLDVSKSGEIVVPEHLKPAKEKREIRKPARFRD